MKLSVRIVSLNGNLRHKKLYNFLILIPNSTILFAKRSYRRGEQNKIYFAYFFLPFWVWFEIYNVYNLIWCGLKLGIWIVWFWTTSWFKTTQTNEPIIIFILIFILLILLFYIDWLAILRFSIYYFLNLLVSRIIINFLI